MKTRAFRKSFESSMIKARTSMAQWISTSNQASSSIISLFWYTTIRTKRRLVTKEAARGLDKSNQHIWRWSHLSKSLSVIRFSSSNRNNRKRRSRLKKANSERNPFKFKGNKLKKLGAQIIKLRRLIRDKALTSKLKLQAACLQRQMLNRHFALSVLSAMMKR